MPNHFHLVLWPEGDADLSRWMHRLMNTHVRRYHQHYHGSGHVWQGRFKAFPIEQDEHLLTVLRYVERNALRAGLVGRAEDWPWSSLYPRPAGTAIELHAGPVLRPADWTASVNAAVTAAEEEAVRQCIRRGRPFGGPEWAARTAARLGLNASLRPIGRPGRPDRTDQPELF
jgi:putative transposase